MHRAALRDDGDEDRARDGDPALPRAAARASPRGARATLFSPAEGWVARAGRSARLTVEGGAAFTAPVLSINRSVARTGELRQESMRAIRSSDVERAGSRLDD